jgi:hypothetical protein
VQTKTPYRKRDWVVEELGDDGPDFLELLADPSVIPAAISHELDQRRIFVPYRTVYRWCQEARTGRKL